MGEPYDPPYEPNPMEVMDQLRKILPEQTVFQVSESICWNGAIVAGNKHIEPLRYVTIAVCICKDTPIEIRTMGKNFVETYNKLVGHPVVKPLLRPAGNIVVPEFQSPLSTDSQQR